MTRGKRWLGKRGGVFAALVGVLFVLLLMGAGAATGSGEEGPVPAVPEGFEINVFVEAPAIYSPASFAVSSKGEVFVAEDEYNSGDDRALGLSKVVRCVDTDGDGKADSVAVFADGLNSPQGMTHVGGTLYVVHAPYLTAFRDADGDGAVDSRRDLVHGLGPEPEGLVQHVPSGLHMGIDGWLYLSIGDKGIKDAVGADGGRITLMGGGVVRVRPDGTELEVFATGLRNTYEVAVGPMLEAFTRDNTNDGGGWNVRLSHIVNGAEYGYPSLFVNFADETVAALADYGGGSGTGGTFVCEPANLWPAGFGHNLYTTDWGRGKVYRHVLTPKGATFEVEQHEFLTGQHPLDIDMDGLGRMYVLDWGDRGWGDVRVEGKKGIVYRITPKGLGAGGVGGEKIDEGDGARGESERLVEELVSGSLVRVIEAQRVIAARPTTDMAMVQALLRKMRNPAVGLESKVAILFTLKQWLGVEAQWILNQACSEDELRPWALRAMADRVTQLGNVDAELFVRGLGDADARVRLEAAIGLGRLGRIEMSAALVTATGDEDAVVAHAAMKSLRKMGAWEACAAAVSDAGAKEGVWRGALRAMRGMHEVGAVQALAGLVENDELEAARREEAVATLARMYWREAEYDGSWWGTQPDTRGPYYRAVKWEGSEAALKGLRVVLGRAGKDESRRGAGKRAIERIAWYGIDEAAADLAAIVLDENHPLRGEAAKAFAPMRSTESAVIEAQAAAAMDRWLDRAVRVEAAAAILESNVAAARDHAAAMWGDEQDVEIVLAAMARVPAERVAGQLPKVREALERKSKATQLSAMAAAAHLKDGESIKSIAMHLGEADEAGVAAEALGAIGPARASDEVLGPVTEQLVGLAEMSTGKLDGETNDRILQAATVYSADARHAAEKRDEYRARLAAVSGVVMKYEVVGPLPAAEGRRPFETVYPDIEERPMGPFGPVTVGGVTHEWKRVDAVDAAGVVWLHEVFGTMGSLVSYLMATVERAQGGDAMMLVGSDDGVAVWLNGALVHSNDVDRGLAAYQDAVPVTLRAGSNALLVKVTNTGGPCGVCIRFRAEASGGAGGAGPTVADVGYEKAREEAMKEFAGMGAGGGEAGGAGGAAIANEIAMGKQLFVTMTCVKCHTVERGEALRGPFLGDAGLRLSRATIVDSILAPEAAVAQGFATQEFKVATEGGENYGQMTVRGFVVRESGDEVELRDMAGEVMIIRKDRIEHRTAEAGSSMPAGLADKVTVGDLKALIAYLESLRAGP